MKKTDEQNVTDLINQIADIEVHIEFSDGKSYSGHIQIPADLPMKDFLNQADPFIEIKTDLGRILLMNKHHIIRIETLEQHILEKMQSKELIR